VACPPIVAPCFYGIDMSTIAELFAPRFMQDGRPMEDVYAEMARELGADSLRYLPVESIARAVDRPADELCRACITGRYPTPHGQKLYEIALENARVAGPSDFDRIQQGDVLLTEATTEAFNILLPLLSAIITDSGGALSHAAIISREYGIPGVVGTRDATVRIADGTRVRVDGDEGTVTVLE